MGSKTVTAATGTGSISVGYHRATDLWRIEVVQVRYDGIRFDEPRHSVVCLDPSEMATMLDLMRLASGAAESARSELRASAADIVRLLA